MRYRKMDAGGDYVFAGNSPFLIDTPEAVAQAVLTRLRLFTKEWFLDQRIGLDKDRILGYGTAATRDREVQRRILLTANVTRLRRYYSTVENRRFRVVANIDTTFGPAVVEGTF